MNKKESSKVLSMLRASFPADYRNITPDVAQSIVDVWAMQFANISVDIVIMAINKIASTQNKAPTIAEVKKRITALHWDAYEMIERHTRMHNLTDEQLATYKRIYKETEKYKFGKVEPSISDMLPNI